MAFTAQFPIIDGPSKWKLSLALFESSHHTITIKTKDPLPNSLEICVTSVQAADGSSEGWNIEGWVADAALDNGPVPRIPSFVPAISQRVFIHFRTDRREGYIKFAESRNSVSISELDQILRQAHEGCFVGAKPVQLRF